MGGSGSGRWGGKDTVEQHISIDISRFYNEFIGKKKFEGHDNADGTLWWNTGSSIGYRLRWSEDKPELTLFYSYTRHAGDKQDKLQRIRIQATRCNYGGFRYWLVCPYCARQVKKLYCVGGNFGCRHCHDLAYTSSQEAHKYDGLGRSLGVNMAVLDRAFEIDNLMERWYKKEHLTKGERRKIADYLGLPLFMVRNKFYKPKTRLRMLAAKAKKELERRNKEI